MIVTTHPPEDCSTCARLADKVGRTLDLDPGAVMVADRCGDHEAVAEPVAETLRW